MVNSISDEPARWAMLPVLKEHRPKVIALCLSESGTPTAVDDRVATGPHGQNLLAAVSQIAARYPGVHISAGVSNVSFGLPVRKLLNQSFLLLLMAHGLDAAIVDPCDPQLMMNLIAAEALLGRDAHCKSYVRAYREGKLGPVT
jgi:5-methyltetrahydrofolate--homocysteine methyltransferase